MYYHEYEDDPCRAIMDRSPAHGLTLGETWDAMSAHPNNQTNFKDKLDELVGTKLRINDEEATVLRVTPKRRDLVLRKEDGTTVTVKSRGMYSEIRGEGRSEVFSRTFCGVCRDCFRTMSPQEYRISWRPGTRRWFTQCTCCEMASSMGAKDSTHFHPDNR